MEYDIDGTKYEAKLRGPDAVAVDGREMRLEVMRSEGDRVEFLLDNAHHAVRYVRESAGKIEVEVDGVPVALAVHTGLDEIVYKNSGGAGGASTDSALASQIPGKVVSVAVSAGDSVSEGDTVCVLESMKMQVSVKARAAGTVKSVRVRVGASIAKGDLIAEMG